MRKRVLIIEDEAIVARSLTILLRRWGYDVAGTADNGFRAIELAMETLPDLLLMDVRLDGLMDGLEAAAQIVEQRSVPVVYLTAYANTMVRDHSKMVAPFLCVTKPFSEDNLQAAIETALRLTVVSGSTAIN